MRLTQDEQRSIAEAARSVLPAGSRVLLFGSRTDDARRGGDVDLLLETASALAAADSVRLCRQLMAQLYWRLGERRIDMLVSVQGTSSSMRRQAERGSRAISLSSAGERRRSVMNLIPISSMRAKLA